MIPCLSGLLAEMNGTDLVACGILALAALWAVLWSVVTWTPIAISWTLSRLARWHAWQVRRANEPQPHPPSSDTLAWGLPLLVILPLVALVVAIIRCNGVGK